MSKLVNLVTVRVDPAHLEEMKAAMLENARNSVKEDGCLQFDVIQSQEDHCGFVFYEIYDDEAALASHRKTPHFLNYWKLIEDFGDKVQREAKLFKVIS